MRQLLGASHNDTSIISMACINFLVAFLLQNKWVVDIGDWRQEMRATLQFLSVAIAAIAFQFILMPDADAACTQNEIIMGTCNDSGGGGGQVQGQRPPQGQTPWQPGQPLPGPDGTIPGVGDRPLPGPSMHHPLHKDLAEYLLDQGFLDESKIPDVNGDGRPDPTAIGPDLAALGDRAGNCTNRRGQSIGQAIGYYNSQSESSVSYAALSACQSNYQAQAARSDYQHQSAYIFTDPRTFVPKLCVTQDAFPNSLGATACHNGTEVEIRYPQDEAGINNVNEFLRITAHNPSVFNIGTYAVDQGAQGNVVDLTNVTGIIQNNQNYLSCGNLGPDAPHGVTAQGHYDRSRDRAKALALSTFANGANCGSAAAQGGGAGGIIQN